MQSLWSETAAWVEAIGAIAAVIGAGWVAARDARAARRREDRAEAAALRKEQRMELATRTAALNLGILASTQIHDLHVLLLDEAWRGRVARVSASRSLAPTQHMLTAFPIQSLGDAAAMVEFCRFPASLATAAEIYSNLESAVRAAPEADRDGIFDVYNRQMERLDASVQKQLESLRASLNLPSGRVGLGDEGAVVAHHQSGQVGQ
jgi:hypothetical protein